MLFRLFSRVVTGLRRNAVLLVLYGAFGALLTIRLGQDVNWDLANYHFYDVYQLLGGRLSRDVDVAGVQTYMNPLFDIPFFISVYWLRLPPIVIGASLGAFHGLTLFFVHKIMVALVGGSRRVLAHAIGALAAMMSAFGAGFYSEVGGTMGDATVAVFVLAAVWQLVSRAGRDAAPAWRSAGWAGLLAGLAMGKLVAAIYVLGLGAAVVSVGRSISGRIIRAAAFGVLAICGAAIAHGYWAWIMKAEFGSPFFPYLTKVIERPVQPIMRGFAPRDLSQQVFYPFYFALRPQALLVSEIGFREARMAAAYCGVVLFVLAAGARAIFRRGALRTAEDGRLLLLIVAGVASFLVWQYEGAVYRYAIPLEALASTVILGSLVYVFRSGIRALLIGIPVSVYLFGSTVALNWGRIDWQSSYFGMNGVQLTQYENATIFLWEMPNGYLVPYFPQSATFLRLASNWNRFRTAPILKTRLEWTVQGADRRKVYLLETRPGDDMDKKELALEQLGLTLDLSGCHGFSSALDVVRICAVRYLDK